MVCAFSRHTFMAVPQATMKLVQRVSSAVLLIAVAGIGLDSAAEAHSDHQRRHHGHHQRHHHGHKKQKAYNKGYRQGYKEPCKTSIAPITALTTAPIPRCMDRWFHLCTSTNASSLPQHRGWLLFIRITTATASMSGLGTTCRDISIHHV